MKIIILAVVLSVFFEVEGLFPFSTFQSKSVQQPCQNPKDYTRPTPVIDTSDPIILDAVQSVIKMMDYVINTMGSNQTAISLAIVYNQTTLWSGGFGTMNYLDPLAPKPDGDTIYKIASQTKLFTALMLMMLRDANLVKLEDSVMEKLPKFRLAGDPFGTNRAITFKNLATQMSGIPRESPCGVFNMDSDCNETGPVWDLIARMVFPIWPPSTLPSYSNLGYSILGRSLAALVGTGYEQWVETNIIKPLEMTSSGFYITDDIAKRMPTIQGPNSLPWEKQTSLGWSNPAGQMYASVNDMTKLIKKIFFAVNETMINQQTVSEMLSPAFNFFDGTGGYALPFEVKYWNNLWVMTKGGDIPGFSSMTAFINELKIGITLSSESALGNELPVTDVMQAAVGIIVNAVEKVLANAQQAEVNPPPQDQVENIVGCYLLENYLGTNITVFVTIPGEEGGELEISSPEISPTEGIFASFRGCTGTSCMFQLDMLPTTCFVGETGATQGQYVLFDEIQGKRLVYFPTLFGGNILFWKKNCV